MGQLKKALVAIVGAVVGILTLRTVRKRRSRQTEDKLGEMGHENPETAAGHTKAAVEHTRHAVRKAKQD